MAANVDGFIRKAYVIDKIKLHNQYVGCMSLSVPEGMIVAFALATLWRIYEKLEEQGPWRRTGNRQVAHHFRLPLAGKEAKG